MKAGSPVRGTLQYLRKRDGGHRGTGIQVGY